jgi:hypothetical protein
VFSLPFAVRRVATAISGLALAAVLAPAVVVAAPPTSQALNPEPLPSYTCKPVGAGTICRSLTFEPYGPDPTGIFCGTGEGAFEALDTADLSVSATRYYDTNGNLTRRERIFAFDNAHMTNPITGARVDYQQHNTDWDVLGVPGDLSTSTWHGHGVLSMTVPGMGSVLHGSGVEVVAPDGSLIHQGGRDELADYYATGDTAIIAELCAALGG